MTAPTKQEGIASATGIGSIDYTTVVDYRYDNSVVYLDVTSGVAGIIWPIGSPAMPSNNITDALAIMAQNNTDTIILVGTGTITFTADTELKLVGNGGYIVAVAAGITVEFNAELLCNSLTLADGATVTVKGNLTILDGHITNTTGSLTVDGNCYNWFFADGNITNTSGSISISGNCYCAGKITNTTGAIYIAQNAYISGDAVTLQTIVNSGSGYVVVAGNLTAVATISNTGTGFIGVYGNCLIVAYNAECSDGRIDVLGSFIISNGSVLVSGTGIIVVTGSGLLSYGDITVSDDGSLTFYGDCVLACGNISNSSTDIVAVEGNCSLSSGNITNSGTGTVSVHQDLRLFTNAAGTVGNIVNSSTGLIVVHGNCEAHNITVAGGGTVTIDRIAKFYGTITNAGTLTYMGDQPVTNVAINAVNTGETDFLNLPALDNLNMKYTIGSLRLKCVDPGLNTVTVKLYEFISGAMVAVDSFAITTAISATYFSLMDMFNLPSLVGNQLKITVQSSAGTYAVTGSYGYDKNS